MLSIILKIIKNKILLWTLLIAALIFVLYTVVITNIYLFTPYLQEYNQQIAKQLSATFMRPIQVGSSEIVQRNLQPIFVLRNITILDNESTKNPWHIRELRVGINVWRSILHMDIVKEWIKIDGTTVVLQTNGNGSSGFSINGINVASDKDAATFAWDQQLSKQGSIKIRLANVNLIAEDWFTDTITVNDLATKISWQNLHREIKIKLWRTTLNHAALRLRGDIHIKWPQQTENQNAKSIPDVDAHIRFTTARLDKLRSLYPTKVMNVSLVRWLKNAFSSSGKIDGTLTIHGNLAHFPFHEDNNGLFKVAINLSGVDFLYHKDWPELKNVNGQLLFKGKAMEVIADSATIQTVTLHNITAKIDDLPNPLLTVDGKVNTSAKLAQHFVTTTPLLKILGHYFTQINIEGPIAIGLHMALPLAEHTPSLQLQLNGVINLLNNILVVNPWKIRLHDLKGAINFTETNITADNLTAILFNSPVALHANTIVEDSKTKNKITQITFNHSVPLAILSQHFTTPIFNYLQGEFTYQGVLQLPHTADKKVTFDISSNLRNIAINYPPLLVKAAEVAHDFSASFAFSKELAGVQIFLHYKNELSAALNFAKHKNQTQLTAGELRFGGEKLNKIPTQSGLLISGKIPKLDFAKWQPYLWDQRTETKGSQDNVDILNIINKIDIKTSELDILGRVFSDLHFIVIPREKSWSISLDSPIISGTVSIPTNLRRGTIVANLQKLYLDSTTQKKINVTPKDLPPLNITVEDFRYGKKALGQMYLQTIPSKSGLRITSLAINATNYMLEGAGQWLQIGRRTQSFIQGKCTSKNAGEALKRLTLTESLAGGSGVINFSLGWQGAFYSIDPESLNGDVKIDIGRGRIVNLGDKTEAEVGFGRLLTIVGLQTLPRRLTLDFSDLVQDGLSFDTMKGDFKLTNGNAFTQNMELTGPTAEVQARGQINFAAKNYDIKLTVIPHFTSSLPVIATVAGGPIIGAATWVANKLIGEQITRSMAYVYSVKGPWTKPNIQKL